MSLILFSNSPARSIANFLSITLIIIWILLLLWPQDALLADADHQIILVMIKAKFMSCPLCQELLNNFFLGLYNRHLQDKAIGIYIPRSEDISFKGEKRLSFFAKQLRGYILGNDIRFPIVLDGERLFSGPAFDDVDIILLSLDNNILKKYRFPLTQEQWDKIQEPGFSH